MYSDERDSIPAYRRELPGGGYVLIEVDDGEGEPSRARTRVWVERRALGRRDGHNPVIVIDANGDARSQAYALALRLASDNAELARALLAMEDGAA